MRVSSRAVITVNLFHALPQRFLAGIQSCVLAHGPLRPYLQPRQGGAQVMRHIIQESFMPLTRVSILSSILIEQNHQLSAAPDPPPQPCPGFEITDMDGCTSGSAPAQAWWYCGRPGKKTGKAAAVKRAAWPRRPIS